MSIYSKPFCVYITFLSHKDFPPIYIGSGKTEDVKSGKYKGSPSRINLKTIRSDAFVYATFDTRKEAYEAEEQLHLFLKVDKCPVFLNKCIGQKYPDMTDKKRSPETCAKISAVTKGQIPWNKGKKTEPTSPQTKTKQSAAQKGISKSEEHKASMRKPKSKTKCPHCQKEVGNGGRYHFENCKLKEFTKH